MVTDLQLYIIIVVAILLMALIIALVMYGLESISVMELWDYESWSEPFGYALLITFILVTMSFFQIVLINGDFKASINFTGVVVPLAVAFYLLVRRKVTVRNAAISMCVVALISFPLVALRGGQVVIDFPWWLLPAGAAAATAWLLTDGNLEKALPLAYIAGSIGMLLGGDLIRLLIYPGDLTEVYLGANGLLDFVFLGGIISCGLLIGVVAAVYMARKLVSRIPEMG
jgi:hypothetical protein